jgi:hypothetical protein
MPFPTAHRVTTAHLQAAYPFMSEGGLGGRGTYIGNDLFGGAFVYDPWELYRQGVLTNPNALIAGTVGKGKALAVDTPVPTAGGWTTMGALEVGDRVFDELGRQVEVIAATEVLRDRACYRVTFSDGQQIVADAEHQWVTWDHRARNSLQQDRKRDRRRPPARRRQGTDAQIARARRLAEDASTPAALTVAEVARHVGCSDAVVRAAARSLPTLGTTQRPLDRPTTTGRRFARQAPTRTFARTLLAAGVLARLDAVLSDQRDKRVPPGVRTTVELRATLWHATGGSRRRNHAIPLCGELDHPKADLPIDPYVLGAWLGDGGADRGVITCAPSDRWIVDRIAEAGYEVRDRGGLAWSVPGLKVQLRALGVLGDKHVPDAYLCAAPDQRLALLQGLMDTDGHASASGQCEFTSVNPRLAAAVQELATGLGIKAVTTQDRARLEGRDCGPRYRVRFQARRQVFSLPRKQARLDAKNGRGRQYRNEFRYVTAVEPVPSVPVRCIQVDSPTGLFLAGRGCVPTHNSALVKSYIWRQSIFGRRSVVLSPKPGEYDRLAEKMGATPISLFPGGTVRLNPLDPMIAPQAGGETAVAQHRETLLVSLAEAAVRRPLEPEEVTACGLALNEARPDANGVLTLPAVVDALLRPTEEAARSVAVDVATLAADGRKCGLALRRLVTGDLRGMFDSPTTSGVTLGGPLTVIDLSRMYNSPALGIIMLCANAWQQAAVSRSDGGKWIAVSEEAWATLRYNSVARAMQESFKLARSYGVQHVIVMHRLSDLEAAGAAGSETRTLAQGLLEDTETRIILNQPPGEIATAVRLLGLTEAEAALLPTLPRARGLWKIADRSFLVDHRLSPEEWDIIDTDARMAVEAPPGRPAEV